MKIAVALSGGLDSTAVAQMMLAAGHEVIGLTLRLCPDLDSLLKKASPRSGLQNGLPEHGCSACVAPCACVEATRAAQQLGIAHEIIDARALFEETVIQPFVRGFSAGITPNPCSLCNWRIKFGLLLAAARARGAEKMATGHYARISFAQGKQSIYRAQDQSKDQTYFLARVPSAQFTAIEFPLGNELKQTIKAAARAQGNDVDAKKTSTEICFLQDYHYVDFLRMRIPEAFVPGKIVDETGHVLGKHEGLPKYTIGQRKGLGIASRHPLYVIRLDAAANQVVVGPDQALWTRQVQVKEFNFLAPLSIGQPVFAMIRYRQVPALAMVRAIKANRVCLEFEQPVRAVTPGQIAAIYHEGQLLGGGEIELAEVLS